MVNIVCVVILLLCLSCLVSVSGHEQPYMSKSVDCSGPVEFKSYHIHTLFWQNNVNSTAAAEAIYTDFKNEWTTKECAFTPMDVGESQKVPCLFEPDYKPAGPFLTGNFAYFVPVSYHEKLTSWFLQQKSQPGVLGSQKNKIDLFIHPNSGCSSQDHTTSAVWGGNRWELDVDALHS